MEARAEARFVRVSAQKARLVIDLIRGRKAGEAITVLRGTNKRIAPTVDELATEYAGRLVVAKMDVDQNQDTPGRLGISSIPTLMLFKGGEMVDVVVGAVDKGALKKMVDRHLA